jgi:endonuclease-3 related protein
MNKFEEIYKLLHKAYGKQGWWPIINDKTLLCEYGLKAPRNDSERFEIMIGAILTQGTQWYPNVVRAIQQLKLGRQFTKEELEVLRKAEMLNGKISERPKKLTKSEILTQNTAWTNVEKALEQLHKGRLVNHERILKTRQDKLAPLIRSAGYYNQKAERLIIMSEFLKENSIASLMKRDAGSLRETFLGIKGVGPETADSIVLYAFGKPTFVIDTYTKRIFSRIGICGKDIDYSALQDIFMKSVKPDVKRYKEYHALIVEHAKRHCRAKPECAGCPIRSICKRNI